MGLLCLAVSGFADARNAEGIQASGAAYLAAAPLDNEDEEDDEEEEAVDYRDRVREIQQWMNRRETERKGGAPGLDVAPAEAPALSKPYPQYFQSNSYDENGYRRLDGDVRVRLRDAPRADYVTSGRRHSSWHRHGNKHARYHGHSYRHGYHPSHSGGRSRHYSAHSSHHGVHLTRHTAASPRHAAKAHSRSGKRGPSRR